jgi:hypothetical protein
MQNPLRQYNIDRTVALSVLGAGLLLGFLAGYGIGTKVTAQRYTEAFAQRSVAPVESSVMLSKSKVDLVQKTYLVSRLHNDWMVCTEVWAYSSDGSNPTLEFNEVYKVEGPDTAKMRIKELERATPTIKALDKAFRKGQP